MKTLEILPANALLAKDYVSVRNRSVKLCEPLLPEDFVVQPIIDVSPPKWHLAHSTWFFENFILVPNKPGYKLFNEKYKFLFNSYYESVGKRVLRINRGNLTRPSVNEIYEYRRYVDANMARFFEDTEINGSLKYFIELGLNHEQQHQELLLTDIKYILGNNPLFPAYTTGKESLNELRITPLSFTDIKEGIYEIGHSGTDFCFDNEKGVHNVFLHDFRIANRLVTNREYLNFIEDGGYTRFQYWLADGWEWLKENKVRCPEYWYNLDGEWNNYTLQGLHKLIPEEPVTHISFFEADAYTRWCGKRLPTEFEWEAASRIICPSLLDVYNFSEHENYHPKAASGDNFQFFGDTWEWTNSAYLPYPYYKQETGALGEYNGKFMINQMVLRGGSCATPRKHYRLTYRNFFQPDKRWQFTGIRLAESF